MNHTQKNTFIDRLLLISICTILALRLLSLGVSPLLDPSEGRYTEISRNMAATGEWFMPHLAGTPFWSKPPLHFILTAFSFKVFGFHDFAARLPNFMGALILLAIVFFISNRLYGRRAALCSMLVLSSTAIFFFIAGFVLTEMTLAVCISAALLSLFLFFESHKKIQKNLYSHLFFVCIGLGMLTKGPVTLALCVVALVIASFLMRSSQVLKKIPWTTGLLITALVFIPWLIIAEYKTPGFLRYYIINEHIYRYFQADYGDRYGSHHSLPYGTILAYWIIASLPWVPLFFKDIINRFKKSRQTKDFPVSEALIMGWALACPVFYFFSRNVVITYLLPSTPAFAILAGKSMKDFLFSTERPQEQRYRTGDLIFVFGFLGALAAQIALIYLKNQYQLSTAVILVWGFLTITWALVYFFTRAAGHRILIASLIIPLMCVYYSYPVSRFLEKAHSGRELASVITKITDVSQQPAIFFDTPPFSTMFYLNGATTCLNRSPNDLEQQILNSKNNVFVIRQENMPHIPPSIIEKMKPLGSVHSNLIFMN